LLSPSGDNPIKLGERQLAGTVEFVKRVFVSFEDMELARKVACAFGSEWAK
jgi:hypothetical protein